MDGYNQEQLQAWVENDEISSAEEGFMVGYLGESEKNIYPLKKRSVKYLKRFGARKRYGDTHEKRSAVARGRDYRTYT